MGWGGWGCILINKGRGKFRFVLYIPVNNNNNMFDWSLTTVPTTYIHEYNVLNMSLNKTFPVLIHRNTFLHCSDPDKVVDLQNVKAPSIHSFIHTLFTVPVIQCVV